ncbi:MAG TPA: diguanylate cyclase [Gaiellales bacterium]|nr:diguanylate cyclase [Gaiellales bacterium]
MDYTETAGGRLLLVGDDRLSAALTRGILEQGGHRVGVVCAGPAALGALARDRYDLVVTDRMLPGMDGLDLCREIRADRALDGLHVILVAGHGQQVVEGLAAGADDYLTTPFDPAELLARVASGMRVVWLRRELAAANRALRELAMTDALTGLPNRQAMEHAVAAEAARVTRARSSSCVVCVDLDAFKAVNDIHGRTVGDLVLVAFAGALRARLRTQDEFGRTGGDEFLILLRDMTLAGAVDVCRRLGQESAAVRVPCSRGDLATTASFGVAAIQPGDDPHQALDVADAALYAAKAAGRNRVEAATESLA